MTAGTWRSRSRLGSDCLTDATMLQAEPRVFRMVASEPTVSSPILIELTRILLGAHKWLALFSNAQPTPTKGEVLVSKADEDPHERSRLMLSLLTHSLLWLRRTDSCR